MKVNVTSSAGQTCDYDTEDASQASRLARLLLELSGGGYTAAQTAKAMRLNSSALAGQTFKLKHGSHTYTVKPAQ